jgi:hypothetical protein
MQQSATLFFNITISNPANEKKNNLFMLRELEHPFGVNWNILSAMNVTYDSFGFVRIWRK